ncbi:hypothetical protein HU200_010369 [Digitaria exilis]|uniref:non-specific serine/threonine protein kinase n=1 Tax=Digitaria exilis TaxID=1010633 RepID=A0A835FIG6_9POAL|nr:hypothetical protein HU200_010369 [Digitaria exilis]
MVQRHNGIPKLTVVWVANRETPIVVVPGSSSTSSPTLSLTNASNLVLSDAGGRVVWSTDIVTGTAATSATLTNSRNLEVRSPMNSTMLWQSFELADTFLPDMKIRASRVGRPGDRLVSWKAPGDPSPGIFASGIDPVTSLQLFTWNGSSPLPLSGAAPWTGYRVGNNFIESTSTTINLTVLDVMDDDASMSFTLSPGGTITRESPAEGYQFSVVSFRDIIAATDNFHESYMIGQGGFGKVYKANLYGQEVAIKRICRDSEQGILEFRNEVVLIAKLQHRNLVKFFGCCIEGDEKLLILEYMPV